MSTTQPHHNLCAWDGKPFDWATLNEVWWALGLPCCSREHQQNVLRQDLQADPDDALDELLEDELAEALAD